MDSNFEYYKAFYYVAKYENLAKAASVLKTSQPAVTPIKAMRGLGGLRDVSKMKPWFFKIISNTAISWIQKQKKTTTSTLEDMEPLLSAQDDYSQMMVEDMLSALDEKYKSVLVLRYFERMTIAEIGEVLDLNENTVKTRLYRALEQLRIQMEVDVS